MKSKPSKSSSALEVCFLSAETEEECESWIENILENAYQGTVFNEGNQISKKEQKAILAAARATKEAEKKKIKQGRKDQRVKKEKPEQKKEEPLEEHYESIPYFGVPLD